jgi:hypothetical protein
MPGGYTDGGTRGLNVDEASMLLAHVSILGVIFAEQPFSYSGQRVTARSSSLQSSYVYGVWGDYKRA